MPAKKRKVASKRDSEAQVAELQDEVRQLKEKMETMEQELCELREYKAAKESEDEDDEDDGMMRWDFACCKHIDESESVNQVYACPTADVYCTQCDCKEPCSYGDFEEKGIYWWRCEECIWQNGGQYELLCDECVDRRNNPKSCDECGASEKDGALTAYKEQGEFCEDCYKEAKEEDEAVRCTACEDKEADVGPLTDGLCSDCLEERQEEEKEKAQA